jgi:hypothetical protein
VHRPYVRAINPRDVREVFGKTSQSNQFQVTFSGIPQGLSNHLSQKFNVKNPNGFMQNKGNLLCSEASLPGTSLATAEAKDNFMGIPQEFAHTRLYTDIDFTYLIDYDYTILRIFEGWIDYISSGSENEKYDSIPEMDNNYYRRMRYPKDYKSQSMFVTKFERDFKSRIDYQFYNIFPKLMTAVPLSYGGADVLKLGVSFNYDRYIVSSRQQNNSSKGGESNGNLNSSSNSSSNSNSQVGELNAWNFGSEASLNLSKSLNISDSFNFDPQMYKGLTKTQMRDAFTNAATWTSTGGGGKIAGNESLNKNYYRISESESE